MAFRDLENEFKLNLAKFSENSDYILDVSLERESEVRIIADYRTKLHDEGYMYVKWILVIEQVGGYGVELRPEIIEIISRDGESINFEDVSIYYEMDTLTKGEAIEFYCESLYFEDDKLELITFKGQQYR